MKVGVHSGVFHADDACAVAALKRLHSHVEVVRTRDPKLLESCDLRVDVGGCYDHSKLTYDHHQRGGAGARENGVPYSGFGLLWRHYGLDVCGGNPLLVERVDKALVQPVDATDCGFRLTTGDLLLKDIIPVSFSAVISTLNPSWHEDVRDFDSQFLKAVDLAGVVLERVIVREAGELFAQSVVRKALKQCGFGGIMVLDRFCPWDEIVVTESNVSYVVFPSEIGEWMVQCVPPTLGSFEQRKPLPEEWAGLRGADLATLTNIPDVIFCHPARFICGAKSRESAIKMAEMAFAR